MAGKNEQEDREILITRDFDAPRELVFRAWTDAERLERWYAPRGCTIAFRSLDFREGGRFHSCIRSPDGSECWCKGEYRRIVAPERIEFTIGISDEAGNSVDPVDAGMDPGWPAETLVTVTFAEFEGRTRLTLRQTVSESLAKRTGAHPSWIQMLDRLAEGLMATSVSGN